MAVTNPTTWELDDRGDGRLDMVQDGLVPLPTSGLAAAVNGQDVTLDWSTRKINPGHYMRLEFWQRNNLATYLGNLCAEPSTTGMLLRYWWNWIETTPGSFDFSLIDADIAFIKANSDKQIIIGVNNKSFDLSDNMMPSDIDSAPYTFEAYSGGEPDGWNCCWWNSTVRTRFIELLRQLAVRYDDDPRVEGILTQETATGLNTDEIDTYNYTVQGYIDGINEIYQEGSKFWKNSIYFAMNNFITQGNSELDEICQPHAPFGVGIGGPDILPGQTSLDAWNRIYGSLRRLPPTMLRWNSCQNDSHKYQGYNTSASNPPDGGKYWSPPDLVTFSRDSLGLEYIVWNYIPNASGNGAADSYSSPDVWTYLPANPPIINRVAARGFDVYTAASSSGPWTRVSRDQESRQYTFNGLSPGTHYFRVTARNGSLVSDDGLVVSAGVS